MKKGLLTITLLLLLFIFGAADAGGDDERILLFDVHATVHTDAVVTVRERILVNVLGDQIKRGIIRVFPTDYTDGKGKNVRTEFELLSAVLNSSDVPFLVERRGGDLEIRLGNPDVLLSPGEHLYEITYRTSGWIGFFESHDELFWNVTGNDWVFPIDRVVYRVELPEGASLGMHAAYTGRRGERGGDFRIAPDGSFETTRTLLPGEGFSVAAGWEKGRVTPPPPLLSERLEKFFTAFRIPVMLLFVLSVFSYYFFTWKAKGKDPEGRMIIPIFEPPPAIEAGFARFFREGVYSSEVLASDLLALAVKDALRFEERSGTTWIIRSGKPFGEETLSPLLRSLLSTLFSGRFPEEIPVDSSAAKNFFEAEKLLKEAYERKAAHYSSWNLKYTFLGLLLFLPMFWIVDFLGSPLFSGDVLDTLLVPALIFGAASILWIAGGEAVTLARGKRKTGKGYWLGFSLVLLLAFLGANALTNMLRSDPVVAGGLILATAISLFFARIMPVRTEEGVRLSEKIEGLAMYMGTAERYRLSMLNPPEETPSLFERLLPFALALDVAKTWADSFSAVLEEARYAPAWAVQDSRTPSGEGKAFLLLSAELPGRMHRSASAYTPPRMSSSTSLSSSGRSSGFGGGGSSGRGGGGGGGRGW